VSIQICRYPAAGASQPTGRSGNRASSINRTTSITPSYMAWNEASKDHVIHALESLCTATKQRPRAFVSLHVQLKQNRRGAWRPLAIRIQRETFTMVVPFWAPPECFPVSSSQRQHGSPTVGIDK